MLDVEAMRTPTRAADGRRTCAEGRAVLGEQCKAGAVLGAVLGARCVEVVGSAARDASSTVSRLGGGVSRTADKSKRRNERGRHSRSQCANATWTLVSLACRASAKVWKSVASLDRALDCPVLQRSAASLLRDAPRARSFILKADSAVAPLSFES